MFLLAIIVMCYASVITCDIRELSIHSGKLAKRSKDGSVHVIQLSATHVISNSSTIEDSMTDFCTSLTFMDFLDCRHCLTTNIETKMIDETRPNQWKEKDPVSVFIPFKDRTVRKLSRIYRHIEKDLHITKICLIGGFEEQILRLLAIFLQRRKNLQVSLTIVGYGELLENSENFEILADILENIKTQYSLLPSQVSVVGWAPTEKDLDMKSFQSCDVIHFQNFRRPPYDMEYEYFLGAYTFNHGQDLLSEVVMWNIIRINQQSKQRNKILSQNEGTIPGTLVIIETDDKKAFDNVVTPSTASVPEDMREHFEWLGSAIMMDGTVHFERSIKTDGDLISSCGKQIGAISDTFINSFYSTLYLGIIRPLKERQRSSYSMSSISYPVWKQETLILITFSSSIFLETAKGIQSALIQQMNYSAENVHIIGYMTLKDILQASNYASAVQIYIGAHQGENWLLPKFVLFHTENHWNSYSSKSEVYVQLLMKAEAVMAYSSAHFAYIHQLRHNNAKNKVDSEDDIGEAIVPFYSESIYYEANIVDDSVTFTNDVRRNNNANDNDDSENDANNQSKKIRVLAKKDESMFLPDGYEPIIPWMHARLHSSSSATYSRVFDIASIGTLRDRRLEFAKEMVFHFNFHQSKHVISIPNRPVLLLNCIFGIMDPETGFKLPAHPLEAMGSVLDAADIHTRETLNLLSQMTLNVHQQEEVVLETHRINQLLSLGQVIISERTSYMDNDATNTHQWLLDDSYEQANAVLFVDNWQEMFQIGEELYLSSARARLQRQQITAWQFYRDHIATNVTEFDNLLYHVFKRYKNSQPHTN